MTKHSTQTTPPSEAETMRQKREIRLTILGLIVVIAAMLIVYSGTSKNTSKTKPN